MLNGYSAATPQHLLLDAGKLYDGFTSLSNLGTAVGITRGGCTFNYTPEVKNIGFDGAPGPVKGMKRIVATDATLEINVMEFTKDNILRSAVGLVSKDYPTSPDTKTHDLIKGSHTIAGSEYKNVALVAEISGKDATAVIVIKNALSNSALSVSCTEKEEGVMTITLQGHYDSTDLGTPPFELYLPIDVA